MFRFLHILLWHCLVETAKTLKVSVTKPFFFAAVVVFVRALLYIGEEGVKSIASVRGSTAKHRPTWTY
jgi:hypothetical protein